MSFAKRNIDITFRLGQGEFGPSVQGGAGEGFNTVKLPSGLRVQATISMAGGESQTMAHLQVYGVPLDIMNKLSVLGMPIVTGTLNTVEIEVSDDVNPEPQTVFIGTINQAWADLQNPPDGMFMVTASLGFLDALRPIEPSSYNGSVDVALAMQSIATQAGYLFQNNGVDVRLSHPYLSGTARSQLQALADMANINWLLDDQNTVVIWPLEGSRTDVPVAQVGPDTGMIGYPTWTSGGVLIRMLYNPALRLGGKINVTSDITPANGNWTLYRVDHELETQVPNGKWFTVCEGGFGDRAEPIDLG